MTVYLSTTAPMGGTDDDYRHHAACRNENPELFFIVGQAHQHQPQINAAKQICFRCPVRLRCLGDALSVPHTSGIWGGATEEERAEIPVSAREALIAGFRKPVMADV